MAHKLVKNFGGEVNALAFLRINYAFSKNGQGDADGESKRHDLAEKKLQREMIKWNEDRMKRLDFTDQRLRQKHASTMLMK